MKTSGEYRRQAAQEAKRYNPAAFGSFLLSILALMDLAGNAKDAWSKAKTKDKTR